MKPLLCKDWVVRAILEGRKTQTRRVVKIKSHYPYEIDDRGLFYKNTYGDWDQEPCPFGQPGDRLWVRETHQIGHDSPNGAVGYKADGHVRPGLGDFEFESWRPSIHMPRWASRITLEIVSVRVERLQDISEEDVKAEGVKFHESFPNLWNSLAKPGQTWSDNPWVFVIEFKKVGK